jgi:hypothetical protein
LIKRSTDGTRIIFYPVWQRVELLLGKIGGLETPELVQVEGRGDDEGVTPPERQRDWFSITLEAKRFPLTPAWPSPWDLSKEAAGLVGGLMDIQHLLFSCKPGFVVQVIRLCLK